MYRKIDVEERRGRSNLANPFQKFLDNLGDSDDEELQHAVQAMLLDQDSHDYTDVSTTRQIMFADLEVKLTHFYEVYKAMNARGKFGATKPQPEHVLDTSDVPALLHRLESFISFRLQTSNAREGLGSPARGTVSTWVHTLLSLLKARIVRDVSASTAVSELRRVFRYNGYGTEGVFVGLQRHATYLVNRYQLPKRRDPSPWWTELDVRLLLEDVFDAINNANRAASVEYSLQTMAIIQLVFCTGQRIGAFTAKPYHSDDQHDLLQQQDITLTQTAPQEYSMKLKLRAIKGFTTGQAIEIVNIVSSFKRAENVMMNPIWTIVALLLHRRALKAVGRQDTFASADEFLSSSATEFVGIGAAALFRKTELGHIAMSNEPLDAVLAGQALRGHARNVGFDHAGFHKIRRDFAAQVTASVSLEVARLALSHQLHDDVLHRHYTGGASLYDLASIPVGEAGGETAGPSRHGQRVAESRALSALTNMTKKGGGKGRSKLSAEDIDLDGDPAVANARSELQEKLDAAVAATGIALTVETKWRQKKLDEMEDLLRRQGKSGAIVEDLRSAFDEYGLVRARRRNNMLNKARKEASKMAQSSGITIADAASARKELARLSQERSNKLLNQANASFRLDFVHEDAVKDLVLPGPGRTPVEMSKAVQSVDIGMYEDDGMREDDMLESNPSTFTETGGKDDEDFLSAQRLQAAYLLRACAQLEAATHMTALVRTSTALGFCLFCLSPDVNIKVAIGGQSSRGLFVNSTDVRGHINAHPSIAAAINEGKPIEQGWLVNPLLLPGAFEPQSWVEVDPNLSQAFYGVPAFDTDPELVRKYVGFSSLFESATGAADFDDSLAQLHTTLLTTNEPDPKFSRDFQLAKSGPRRPAKSKTSFGIIKTDGSKIPPPPLDQVEGREAQSPDDTVALD
ncbi:hypothetical protein V8E36_008316 [Tilletia maclaganii]